MKGAWGSLSPAGTLTLGIVVGLLSTCVQSVGLTLQRKSHMLEDEKESHELRRPAYRRRRWQIGMLLFLFANVVGSSIQITTLPLPLLSTLQASGLVFNSLLASLLLKEPWTLRTGYGTVLVAVGAILISLFSALPEPSHSLDGLIRLLGYRSFLIWFILSLVFVAAMLVVDFAVRRFVPLHRRESPKIHLLRGMSYGAISGILSAHALLLAKSAVELIVRSIADKQNQFSNYRSWLLLVAFLVLALSQLYYLHLGLRLISTSVLYPFVFCIYNIVAILDGLIYFRQMDRLAPLHAVLIALGTVILLAGVLALSWRIQDEEEDPDHEHTRHIKHEIPQTLLAPGLGFVGDPSESDGTSESAVAQDGEEADSDEDEVEPLLNKTRKRSTASHRGSGTGGLFSGRKRRRAETLKDIVQIWEEPNEEQYGTFDTDGPTRPASAGHERRRRNSDGRNVRFGGEEGGDVEANVDGVGEAGPRRARTMSAVGTERDGRRRSTHHADGALFSELLKRDWWRRPSRRDAGDGDDEEEGGVGGGGAR